MEQKKEEVSRIINRSIKDSPFFQSNAARELPQLAESDIYFGPELGRGSNGIVYEIIHIKLHSNQVLSSTSKNCSDSLTDSTHETSSISASISLNHKNLCRILEDEQFKDLSDLSESDDESDVDEIDRNVMIKNYFCDGAARYVIKLVRPDLCPEEKFDAIVDLEMEAKFLAVLSHPNIIKLRAISFTPYDNKSFMVLDRLYGTLSEKLDEWKNEKSSCIGFCGMKKSRQDLMWLDRERLVCMFDIALALRWLHMNNIMYRDIKPENIGFDVMGNAKLFDFGLARELKPSDKNEDGLYKLTGLAGTGRYMAPEVCLCKPYDVKADVYSFGILLWEIWSLKKPFLGYDRDKHFEKVVVNGKRPTISSSWPVYLTMMMKMCWSPDISERPCFEQICNVLNDKLSINGEDMMTWLLD